MQRRPRFGFRKVLWTVMLLEAALCVGVWLIKVAANERQSPAVTESLAPPYDFEVTYTSSGYSPDHLEVPLGSRVAFRNATPDPVWTASDPAHTHSDFPALNAGRDYGADEAYIFRFDAPGTYGFGNDRQEAHRGVVRVLDVGRVYDGDKTPPEQVAVRDKLLDLLVPGDAASVFRVIDAIEADAVLLRSCHSVAHDLGHRAYQMFGFSGAMNVSDSTRLSKLSVQDLCAGGYVHGLLEEASLYRQDFNTNPGVLCEDVPEGAVSSCFHGLGHAFMFAAARDYDYSLERCRATGTAGNRVACFEGVWMELFWSKAEEAELNLGWDPDHPLDPCARSAEDAKQACYLYSSFGYLRSHPRDYRGALTLCTSSNLIVEDIYACAGGVGILMVGRFGGQHLERAEEFARQLSPSTRRAFYRGMLNYARFSGIAKEVLESACDAMVKDSEVCKNVLATEKPTTS